MILWDMTRGLQLAVVWCGASVSWSCLNLGVLWCSWLGGKLVAFGKFKEDLLEVTGYYRLHIILFSKSFWCIDMMLLFEVQIYRLWSLDC